MAHNITNNSKRQLHKTHGINYTQGKTESLHPTIKTNFIMLRTHHIGLQMKAFNKAYQRRVSKEAEADQEFTNLLEMSNNIIRECKKSLKAQIIKCIDIKLKLLHQ
eukprot:1707505-Ditylum_brightwellii.AAC.1